MCVCVCVYEFKTVGKLVYAPIVEADLTHWSKPRAGRRKARYVVPPEDSDAEDSEPSVTAEESEDDIPLAQLRRRWQHTLNDSYFFFFYELTIKKQY